MKVLVTGGAGFIGSHIVDRLISLGHTVAVVDDLSTGSRQNLNPGSRFYEMDILDKGLGEVLLKERPEIIIHHAAQVDVQVSQGNPTQDASVNVVGSVNLLNCAVAAGVRKFIYASSAAVYGVPEYLPIDEEHPVKPISNYGISKYTPELYIKAFHHNHKIDYTILRYANVYGPRQGIKGEGGVVFLFAKEMVAGHAPRIFGTGEQTRDFIYVEDIVRVNILAMEKGAGQTLNIGSGNRVSVNELFQQFKTNLGFTGQAQYAEARPGDIDHSVFNASTAGSVLGWKPEFLLAEGLTKTINYYKTAHPNGFAD